MTGGLEQADSLAVSLNSGVMPGGNTFVAVSDNPVHEQAELDVPVADRTGVWRPAFGIAGGEVVQHVAPKRLFQVNHLQLDIESIADRLYLFALPAEIGIRFSIFTITFLSSPLGTE